VNKAGQTKPLSQDTRYGLAIGGPIAIPKVYNGRNKTFFFTTPSTTRYSTSRIRR
jgi:hypothetical protein